MFDYSNFRVYGGDGNHELALAIVKEVNRLSHAKLRFSHLNMGVYPDGESDLRIPNNDKIKDKHIILFQSAYNKELKDEFLDIAAACSHQYGATSIIGVMPFMYSRRQDHEDDMAEINRNRQFIQTMANSGVTRLILCDIHSLDTIKSCKEEGIEAINVDPAWAYADQLRLLMEIAREDKRGFYIYSPDEGSIPRAISLAKILGVKIAVNLKIRHEDGSTAQKNDQKRLLELRKKYNNVDLILANRRLKGAIFCIREDELSTGGTSRMAGDYLRNVVGAHELYFLVTHPVCAPGWKRKLIDHNPFNNIFVGDTIPRGYMNSTGGQMTTVTMAREIAHQLIKMLRKI